jgi:protein-S-isoprenylcysteine O-methyltransferase Ste14
MNNNRATIATVLFLLVAPGVVAGVVPWLITDWRMPDMAPYLVGLLVGLGGFVVFIGIVLLLDCFIRFVREGNGTPMPWMPTEGMIASGPYRYVRNPMYVAVVAIVLGQAILFWNLPLLGYAAGLWIVFHFFVLLVEEPGLRRSYGPAFEAYADAVPRWIPRVPPPASSA